MDKSRNLFKFVLVLLSASVERVGVSRMRDFFIWTVILPQSKNILTRSGIPFVFNVFCCKISSTSKMFHKRRLRCLPFFLGLK